VALFERVGAQILAISINSAATNQEFARKIGATFPLLSDAEKAVTKSVLHPLFRVARRVTFVIDRGGAVRHVEKGAAAVDPAGAYEACRRLEQAKL
jgi:peroxiredoxin